MLGNGLTGGAGTKPGGAGPDPRCTMGPVCNQRSSLGLAGQELAPREAALLKAARPCRHHLFKRNILGPEQVRRLVEAARACRRCAGFLVLIDQEGGACGG